MPSSALVVRTFRPGPVEATIERYVTASCARLDRLLADVELAEPVVREADLAVKALEPLLETLTGLAIGRLIGAVMHGVRRTFEPAVTARVQAAMAGALRTVAPFAAPTLFALDGSPCRAFSHELRQRLRRRIALVPREVRLVLAAMARALVTDELAPFARMLALLAEDPTLDDRFAPQIAIAWCCYAAVVEGAAFNPADATWARWLRMMRGEAEPVLAPTRAQLAAAGVIVRIA
ncbi:MAG TPA: hypothetical protein VM513_20485 [Kofleriaceae bacterium]|jgi:hypothetical protein|nr:hypothetical protein [Kofleriaceae bacterium]